MRVRSSLAVRAAERTPQKTPLRADPKTEAVGTARKGRPPRLVTVSKLRLSQNALGPNSVPVQALPAARRSKRTVKLQPRSSRKSHPARKVARRTKVKAKVDAGARTETDEIFEPSLDEAALYIELESEVSAEFTSPLSSPISRKTKSRLTVKRRQRSRKAAKPTNVRKKRAQPQRKSRNDRQKRIAALIKSGAKIEPLPGRTDEFDWICRTVHGLLTSSLGGCLYVSGVPGTGKTATTHRTLDWLTAEALQGKCPEFDFVEINGMRLSDPSQAYSLLASTILDEGRISNGGAALKRLEAHFRHLSRKKTAASNRPCIVLLDELDLLLRRKQSILYHFFEWPNWANSRLIVVTIANTMDLPERFLSNRISSRLGLTRYNFKPYDHVALSAIIEHQLREYLDLLGKDAIQLCARKVSAVSGDARRAVNLAKRAVDYFRSCPKEELLARATGRTDSSASSTPAVVNLRLMDLVMRDALMANAVQVISQLARLQQLMLLAVILARRRLEDDAALRGGTRIIGTVPSMSAFVPTLDRVLETHLQLCRTHQMNEALPSLLQLYSLLEGLEALKLIRVLRFREAGPAAGVSLLVHEDDVKKGLGEEQSFSKYFS